MARQSAINPVAAAVLVALNVSTVQAACPGGVSRNRREKAPPYLSIGPCSERPDDAMGAHYGAVVDVPVHVITIGEEADGDARGATIGNLVMGLLEDTPSLVVTGWKVRQVLWVSTIGTVVLFQDGLVGYDTALTFQVRVRANT